MKYSIIVPVYNVERYLEECIESILCQKFKDYELILVDDGSTDKSGNICDGYAARNKNIKVLHKKNEGLLMARREGLKLARGEYCIHCDSDDYLSEDFFIVIEKLINENNPDMVMFGYDVVDDNQNILEKHYDIFPEGRGLINDKFEIYNKIATTTWLNSMWSKVTRRCLVDIDADYSKYKSISMGEDLFQVLSLIRNCKSFIYAAKPLYKYRFNNEGISKKCTLDYLMNYLKDYLIVSERLCEFLEMDAPDLCSIYAERFEYDIYKYYLRFLKQGIRKERYRMQVNLVESSASWRKIISFCKRRSGRNLAMRVALRPEFYLFMVRAASIVLKNRRF